MSSNPVDRKRVSDSTASLRVTEPQSDLGSLGYERRKFLRSVGSLAITGLLAGCTSNRSEENNQWSTDSVTSQDGTTIGYRRIGDGPGVILVHGGMQSSASFTELGVALSDISTVYIPDRRGRGLSGPVGESHSLQKECEDLDALLEKTGAHNIFGLSSGAVISLQTAIPSPAIERVAVYEPPLFTEQINPIGWGERYERELAQGKLAEAMITLGKGTNSLPKTFHNVPRFLLVPITKLILEINEMNTNDDQIPLTDLIPTMKFDVQMIRKNHPTPENFKDLSAELLLLGGGESASFLRVILNELETVLPQATRTEFPRLGHSGPDNSGDPERVAQKLSRFFV